MNYDKAVARLGSRASRLVANNTRLERCAPDGRKGQCLAPAEEPDAVCVRLHNTHVVSHLPGGRAVLNSGGWRTATTRSRMCDFGPDGFAVEQERGVWWLRTDGDRWPYADGVTVGPDDSVRNAGGDPRAERRLRARVSEYARAFVDALRAGAVDIPTAGDCIFCLMRVAGGTGRGQTFGEESADKEHLLSHMEERYYVPSLLNRAVEVACVSQAARWTLAGVWKVNGDEDDARAVKAWGHVGFPQLRRALANFIARQLGLAPFRSGKE